jgi:hypothetical protein
VCRLPEAGGSGGSAGLDAQEEADTALDASWDRAAYVVRDTGDCIEDVCFAPPVSEPICTGAIVPPGVVKWVSDFDDPADVYDATLVPNGWEAFSDQSAGIVEVAGGQGPITPIPLFPWGSHDAASTMGMRLQAAIVVPPPGGAQNWGAMWRYETPIVSVSRKLFDLRAYAGLVIWARLAGSPGKGNLIVAFPTPETTPSSEGGDGTCSAYATGVNCDAHYQVRFIIAKTCWAPLKVPFSSLRVPYGDTPAGGFDQAHVFGIELVASAWAAERLYNWPFDVIVDDVYLY